MFQKGLIISEIDHKIFFEVHAPLKYPFCIPQVTQPTVSQETPVPCPGFFYNTEAKVFLYVVPFLRKPFTPLTSGTRWPKNDDPVILLARLVGWTSHKKDLSLYKGDLEGCLFYGGTPRNLLRRTPQSVFYGVSQSSPEKGTGLFCVRVRGRGYF